MTEKKCKWKSKYFLDYECKEPALPRDQEDQCILHSRDESKDPKIFEQTVEERVNTKGNEIDLRGCYFPKNFNKEYFKDRQFDRPVYFGDSTFSQRAIFIRSVFLKKASFARVTFEEGADFSSVKFFDESLFSMAKFLQQRGSFYWVEFAKSSYFLGTTFEKGGDFSLAKFKDGVIFAPVRWRKGKEEIIKEHERINITFDEHTIFRYTRFLGEVIFQEVNLSNCSFIHSNIDQVYFNNCRFKEHKDCLWGRILYSKRNVLRDEVNADEMVSKGPKNIQMRAEEYEPVRLLYVRLKRNFEDKKDWDRAGDFHYGEMECQRKMMAGQWGPNVLFLKAVYNFYYWASGYSERPLKAFCWLIFLPFVFTLAYYWLDTPPRLSL